MFPHPFDIYIVAWKPSNVVDLNGSQELAVVIHSVVVGFRCIAAFIMGPLLDYIALNSACKNKRVAKLHARHLVERWQQIS